MIRNMNKKRGLILTVCWLFIIFAAAFSQKKAAELYKQSLKTKSIEKKIELLTQAVQADPTHARAYFELSLAYHESGKSETALDYLGRTLIADAGSMNNDFRYQVVYQTGLIQRSLGKTKQAKDSFRAARRLTSDKTKHIEILYYLGGLNTELGDFDAALLNFLEGNELSPQDPRFKTQITQIKQTREIYAVYQEANKHFSLNRFAEAIAAYEKVVAVDPLFKDARTKLTTARKKLKTQQKVSSKNDFDNLYSRGAQYVSRNPSDNASQLFQEILDKNFSPKVTGSPLVNENKKATEKQTSRASKKAPDVKALYQSAISYYNAQNWKRAIALFQQIQRTKPRYRDVRAKLRLAGKRFEEQGVDAAKQKLYQAAEGALGQEDWVEAMAYLDRLLNLDPQYKDADVLLKQAQANAGDTSESDWELLMYQKGLRFMKNENWLEARVAFEKVVVIDSNFKNVNALLAEASAKLESENAVEIHRTAGEKGSNWLLLITVLFGTVLVFAGVIFMLQPKFLARFYLKQQRYEKAAAIYEKKWKKNYADTESSLKLAEIYHHLKREDEQAIRVFETVIRMDLDTPIKGEISTCVAYYYLSNENPDSDKIEILEKVLNKEINKIKSIKG